MQFFFTELGFDQIRIEGGWFFSCLPPSHNFLHPVGLDTVGNSA